MNKILISHDKTIEYNEEKVKINNEFINDLEGKSAEAYAMNEMRSYYSKILSSHFENLVVLTGSGSSVDIGTDNKGKTMKGLWKCVIDEIGAEKLKGLCEKVKYEDFSEEYSDLEVLLSKSNTLRDFINDKSVNELIDLIQDVIKKNCTLMLPELSPQEKLLERITSRKLKYPRLKLFTLNYDTLFEQAASKNGYIVIDGFSFTYPRRFGGKNFDYDIVIRENSRIKNEENYAKRVFHLYKLHGSLDWEREGDYIKKSENPKKPVMIYPKNTKYESSYEQPFFEMMSRFQQSLRKPNTFLITLGFSYYDKHISSMIREALNVNPSFRLMVVNPQIENNRNLDSIKKRAEKGNNTYLISEKFVDFVDHYPYPEIYSNNLPDGEDYE